MRDEVVTYEFMVIMDKFGLCVEQTVSTAAAIGLAARGVNMIGSLSKRSFTGSHKTLSTILRDPIVPSSVGQVGLSGYSAFF